jgi:hypothetical protein
MFFPVAIPLTGGADKIHYQQNKEDNQKDEKQNFRYPCRRCGDSAEAEHRCDNRYHQKN